MQLIFKIVSLWRKQSNTLVMNVSVSVLTVSSLILSFDQFLWKMVVTSLLLSRIPPIMLSQTYYSMSLLMPTLSLCCASNTVYKPLPTLDFSKSSIKNNVLKFQYNMIKIRYWRLLKWVSPTRFIFRVPNLCMEPAKTEPIYDHSVVCLSVCPCASFLRIYLTDLVEIWYTCNLL